MYSTCLLDLRAAWFFVYFVLQAAFAFGVVTIWAPDLVRTLLVVRMQRTVFTCDHESRAEPRLELPHYLDQAQGAPLVHLQ